MGGWWCFSTTLRGFLFMELSFSSSPSFLQGGFLGVPFSQASMCVGEKRRSPHSHCSMANCLASEMRRPNDVHDDCELVTERDDELALVQPEEGQSR
eukprot:TRINITY_DN52529_c0_g1_i1.p1 TRINITY_DN52529_c0_g1~~TRINITY_DN52529_c0_g1_i1.p1  ORF type:complete len:113 (-),score=1.29 TRINITY_DN52529_c0_g1_i1:20-310(-)